jgi:hypothetical protein
MSGDEDEEKDNIEGMSGDEDEEKDNIEGMDDSSPTPDPLEKYPQPTIINMVVNYGVQITMYSFYNTGDNLTQYEDLFNYHKSAIIPMAYAINYLGKMETELASKTLQLGSFT